MAKYWNSAISLAKNSGMKKEKRTAKLTHLVRVRGLNSVMKMVNSKENLTARY
jgi:hypothetical protein